MNADCILILYSDRKFCSLLAGHLQTAGWSVVLRSRTSLTTPASDEQKWLMIILEADRPHHGPLLPQSHSETTPFVVIASQGSVPEAVAAIRDGAKDYLMRSFGMDFIMTSIKAIISNLNTPKENVLKNQVADYGPVTTNGAMQSLLDTARRIAPSDATVLLHGESGTGKELLARFIHLHSLRPQGPFEALNCAALPETLAESELFGYEKGAFTGASQSKPGRFELARDGTLLLDEISEMPINLQPKLLRVLQERKAGRLGGSTLIEVNARIVATTNRDLLQMVKEGRFRQDLYYRLRVIPLKIPPLRDRKTDIPQLIDHFIHKLCDRIGRSKPVFSKSAIERMLSWSWPGNVRELENTVQRAILIAEGPTIEPEHLLLDDDLGDPAAEVSAPLVGMTVNELEKKLIIQTLAHVNQNRTNASRMLGISIRTLRNKLREYRDMDCADKIMVSAR